VRAVVDTNILIRALIKPHGTVGPILSRLAAGDYTLIYSQAILDELVEKLALPRLRNKYALDEAVIEATLALVALRGERVEPVLQVRVCRDPDDNQIIAAALAGAASYVVSGDKDLLVLKQFQEIRFIEPHEFFQRLNEESPQQP
jgi:putative PIN family toxin of toxin-antitoxin system